MDNTSDHWPAATATASPAATDLQAGGNGKDKLKSHFENVHRGVGIPPKQPRALVPKE
ncbi:MAG: hypothetical protein Q9184_004329 [Pyrenodesmia sp. 2 TL-2023]